MKANTGPADGLTAVMRPPHTQEGVVPILIGPRNADSVVGLPWRHVRDNYRHLAVRVGRKLVIPAATLLEALRSPNTPQAEGEPVDAAEVIRRQLGVRKRA